MTADPVVRLGIGGSLGPTSVMPGADGDRERVGALVIAAATLALLAALLVGPIAAGVMLSMTLGGAVAVALRRRASLRQRRLRALPEALEAIARDLRTGHSFGAAIAGQAEADSALSGRFRRIASHIELGRPLDEACAVFAEDARGDRTAAAATALLATSSLGGRGSARALDVAADALRQREHLRAEVRSLIAQAESSVRVLAALPAGFVGVGIVTGQAGALALFTTATGRWCLAFGLCANAMGLLWMRRLVRSVVQ